MVRWSDGLVMNMFGSSETVPDAVYPQIFPRSTRIGRPVSIAHKDLRRRTPRRCDEPVMIKTL
eukprot:1188140-Prorocentrum_minimum.AAC.4